MMLLFSPPAAGEAAGTCRCLCAGTDLFVTQENTAACSAHNLQHMAELFTDFLPEGTQVTLRMNGPATAAELESLIRVSFGDAEEGDLSFLYLSTHGVIWEEDGKTCTALILSDGEQEEAVDAESLRRMLDPVAGEKILILDACYSGGFLEAFSGDGYRILASSGPGEESFFWASDEETGTGYFTAALESALRASDADQIDPDGDRRVSLAELTGRIREIYGAAGAASAPETDGRPFFLLPEARHGEERILGLRFDGTEENGGRIRVAFRFRTQERTRLEYRLVPLGEDGWDFSREVRLPDRERAGRVRGMLAPGDKERTLQFSAELLGERGTALLQIISMHGQTPVPECTRVITGLPRE